MSIFKTIVGLLAGNIIKDLGDFGDKNFTTAEEKQKALNEAEEIYNERLKIIGTITEHDSFLSKNCRPLVFLVGFLSVTVLLLFDIEADPWLEKIYVGWVGTMVTLYFLRREQLKHKDRKSNK